MLDDINDFIAVCAEQAQAFHPGSQRKIFAANDLYCPVCGGPRRVSITVLRTATPGLGYLETSEVTPESIGRADRACVCLR
jgi:hypothetical protein